jgi:EAL domain-containing protein (putative c-di-GMP-specific phosphodiesterase class I)
MSSEQLTGTTRPFDSNSEMARVVAAIEVELDANVEVLGPDCAPSTPAGGRLVRLAGHNGAPSGWLRITPRTDRPIETEDDGLVRVLTRVVHEGLAQHGRRQEQLNSTSIRRVLADESLWTVFQPICDLYDGTIVGYEALSRFPEPPKRTPDRWFGDAAALGLGVALEVLAVRRALNALNELPEHVYLSVNISPAAATSEDLADALEDVPVERLVLEITEHAEVADYEILNAAIARLRRRGARLAVDDTGAGFASMRHVLRLAPDIVKLDTTLTQDIDNDSVLRALGFSLKSFASAIDAQVIAEGIETEREVDALRFLGVRYGQGFFLSRPGPLLEAEVLEITTTTSG